MNIQILEYEEHGYQPEEQSYLTEERGYLPEEQCTGWLGQVTTARYCPTQFVFLPILPLHYLGEYHSRLGLKKEISFSSSTRPTVSECVQFLGDWALCRLGTRSPGHSASGHSVAWALSRWALGLSPQNIRIWESRILRMVREWFLLRFTP